MSGSKRRVGDADDLDASLNALTTRLGATTTHDHDSLVALICEILGVDAAAAAFYLEAASNDPHEAVLLHMTGAHRVHATGQHRESGSQKRTRATAPAYRNDPVTIAELPVGWTARVSDAGTIVFHHDASGHETAHVPPGFHQRGPSNEGPSDAMSDAGDVPASPVVERQLDPTWQREFPHVICDACERQISGTRYQCVTRLNYDLCGKCMWSEEHAALRAGHEWIKMTFVAS